MCDYTRTYIVEDKMKGKTRCSSLSEHQPAHFIYVCPQCVRVWAYAMNEQNPKPNLSTAFVASCSRHKGGGSLLNSAIGSSLLQELPTSLLADEVLLEMEKEYD